MLLLFLFLLQFHLIALHRHYKYRLGLCSSLAPSSVLGLNFGEMRRESRINLDVGVELPQIITESLYVYTTCSDLSALIPPAPEEKFASSFRDFSAPVSATQFRIATLFNAKQSAGS